MAKKFPQKIVIGSRGSRLALTQTLSVVADLEKRFPNYAFKVKIIKTKGDKIVDAPLTKINDKGFFTKELEAALLRRKIDFAVHSIKDLPVGQPPGLVIGAITKREEARDVLLKRTKIKLGQGAKVGTSSLRRQAQLKAWHSDWQITDLRGNLDTRLRKLREGMYDAIVVAMAGLNRLKLEIRNCPPEAPACRTGRDAPLAQKLDITKIPFSLMLPAPGQGALAIECRQSDNRALAMLKTLNHWPTELAVTAERALLFYLGGGCQVPIGALAKIRGKKMKLKGIVADISGRRAIRGALADDKDQPDKLGQRLAKKLIKLGAKGILRKCQAKFI
ncbi:hydroxymethylbilane synthase [Candidatus Saganbacteria bacterium]|nr:hydroxymethylbilane synthase [Candidatus Saganbacteria bacterium]